MAQCVAEVQPESQSRVCAEFETLMTANDLDKVRVFACVACVVAVLRGVASRARLRPLALKAARACGVALQTFDSNNKARFRANMGAFLTAVRSFLKVK